MTKSQNIFNTSHTLVTTQERIDRIIHKDAIYWIIGMSGAGKTTIARLVERNLFEQGYQIMVLDGDNLRSGLTSDLGFSTSDRYENIRRAAHTAQIVSSLGYIVLACFVCPTNELQALARSIIQSYTEVWVKADIHTLINRDPKGLYQKAKDGLIENFTGIQQSFEPPIAPHLTLDTDLMSIDECVTKLTNHIITSTTK